MAVIRRPGTSQIFVDEIVDPSTGRVAHRPAGGGIEFGELAADTVTRELREEYGLAVTVVRRLGVLENLFTYDGLPGHEIVLVLEAELCRATDYRPESRPCVDRPGVVGTWRSLLETAIPLYPAGLTDLIGWHTNAPGSAGT